MSASLFPAIEKPMRPIAPPNVTDTDRERLSALADAFGDHLAPPRVYAVAKKYEELFTACLVSAVRNFLRPVALGEVGHADWVADKRWLLDKSTEPFSLAWICDALRLAGRARLDPHVIREWAKKRLVGYN